MSLVPLGCLIVGGEIQSHLDCPPATQKVFLPEISIHGFLEWAYSNCAAVSFLSFCLLAGLNAFSSYGDDVNLSEKKSHCKIRMKARRYPGFVSEAQHVALGFPGG